MDSVRKDRELKQGRKDNCQPWFASQFDRPVRAFVLAIETHLGNSPFLVSRFHAATDEDSLRLVPVGPQRLASDYAVAMHEIAL
jgi:hypothetical protein